MSTNKSTWKKLTSMRLFMPLVCLLAIIIVATITIPGFLSMSLKNGVPYGYPVDVINRASELVILSVGMTLVTAASGGQGISVGAVMAVAGAVCCQILSGGEVSVNSLSAPIIVAFLAALVASGICGAFNGFLVSYLNVQPMVATLILFTAGRSIAAWINNNELPVISEESFGIYGGFIPGIPIPTPVFIMLICVLLTALALKYTNLGLYTQAVGINASSSRLNGLNPAFIKFISFVILGLCVAVVGLIKVSRLSSINYSVIAKDIEMDAILAVALGGNSLSGGKFNMTASILGAYVIQFLTTTLYKFNVESAALSAYKAVVVIALVVFSAPAVRKKFADLTKKMKPQAKEAV